MTRSSKPSTRPVIAQIQVAAQKQTHPARPKDAKKPKICAAPEPAGPLPSQAARHRCKAQDAGEGAKRASWYVQAKGQARAT